MKTIVVTGASKGIGAEIALEFAEKDVNLVINYNKSEKEAQNVAKEAQNKGANVLLCKCDVSSYKDAKLMFEQVIKTFGKVDVLINNAGIASYKLLLDSTEQDIQNVIQTNLVGVINCCKFASENMIKNQYGKIINISSMWGIVGGSGESVYSASKAGIIGFSKALAKELGFSNINVNVVAPGTIRTDMISNLSDETIEELKAQTALNRIGEKKDVVKLVKFLASDDASYITGEVINVNGGIF